MLCYKSMVFSVLWIKVPVSGYQMWLGCVHEVAAGCHYGGAIWRLTKALLGKSELMAVQMMEAEDNCKKSDQIYCIVGIGAKMKMQSSRPENSSCWSDSYRILCCKSCSGLCLECYCAKKMLRMEKS